MSVSREQDSAPVSIDGRFYLRRSRTNLRLPDVTVTCRYRFSHSRKPKSFSHERITDEAALRSVFLSAALFAARSLWVCHAIADFPISEEKAPTECATEPFFLQEEGPASG